MAGRPRKESVEEEEKEITEISEQIEDENEEQEINNLVEQIEDDFDNPIRMSEKVVEFTTTGSDLYDCVGGGGFPWGKMVNVIGDNSTGKTLFCCETIAKKYWEVVKEAPEEERSAWYNKKGELNPEKRDKYVSQYFDWVYDNSESGFSFDTKTIWGFQIENGYRSETIEGFALNMKKSIEKLIVDRKKYPNKKLIYVVDSWDGLASKEEKINYEKKLKAIEKGTKVEGTYGTGKAKGGHEFFRNRTSEIEKYDILLIIVSQVKENINAGLFAPKYIRTGGKALDFFSSQIFWYAIAEKYGPSDRTTGVGVKVINTKNKVGLPYRYCYVDILFDYGVDNISSNIKFLYDLKTDKGKDREKLYEIELDWEGQNFTYRKLIRYIENNNLEPVLTQKVKEKWESIEMQGRSNRKNKYE